MSAYTDFTIERFGGLNLAADPEEVGAAGAVDLLNVDLDRDGRARSRDGFSRFNSAGGAVSPYALCAHPNLGSPQLLSQSIGSTMKAWDSAGSLITTGGTNGGSNVGISFALIGLPTATYTYFCYSGSTSGLYRWDGTAFTALGAVSSPIAVAATPWDNRLVAAGQAVTASRSRVAFSDPGAPDTFGANNYVDLTPGDGEPITAAVTWREFVFVFKKTKFFVFYGTSLASDGVTPVFNYRSVTTGYGMPTGVSPQAACAARDGVYFWSGNGVFRTTGGVPERVSQAIDPFLRGESLPFFGVSGSILPGRANTSLAPWRDRVLMAIPTNGVSGDQTTFMFDPATGVWTCHSIPAKHFAAWPGTVGAFDDLLYATSNALSSGAYIYERSTSATTDDGAAITSRYRTGFYDLGIDEEKTIRETTLAGQGTVAVSMSRDFGSLGTATNATLGTAPATARKHVRVAQHGDTFSTQLASVSGGAWQVNRLTHHVREQRRPGAKTT